MSELDRIDLTALMPEKRKSVIIDDEAGNKYEIKLFIPPAALPVLCEFQDELSGVMSGNPLKKLNPGHVRAMSRIFEVIVKEQHSFMDEAWIIKNINMARMLFIMFQLSVPLKHQFAYISEMGLMGEQAETAGPVKEPDNG